MTPPYRKHALSQQCPSTLAVTNTHPRKCKEMRGFARNFRKPARRGSNRSRIMSVDHLRRRVDALRRKMALALVVVELQPAAEELCDRWAIAQANQQPLPENRTLVDIVVRRGYFLQFPDGSLQISGPLPDRLTGFPCLTGCCRPSSPGTPPPATSARPRSARQVPSPSRAGSFDCPLSLEGEGKG